MLKAVIFDWNGTLYDKDAGALIPSARKVVAAVRERYKVGLLSRGDPEKRRATVAETGLQFDAVHVVQEKGTEELQALLAELGVHASEALIVDDYVIRGIQAGNALGCTTCWVRYGKHKDIMPTEATGQPTYQVDDIAEVLDIL